MAKAKRKTASDLWKVQELVTISDGRDEFSILVVKLNDPDQQAAVSAAIAAKARVLAQGKNPDSDLYLELLLEAQQMEFDMMVEILVMREITEQIASVEAELAAEKPWGEDDYLRGLQDLWVGDENDEGLGVKYDQLVAAGEEVPDTIIQIRDQLEKFSTELAKRMNAVRDDAHDAYAGMEPEYLHAKVVDQLIEFRADQEFQDEYLRRRTYLSAREPENRLTYHFDSLADYDDADDKVKLRLQRAYQEMTVEGAEGKDSPGKPGSSPSSDQPATADPTTDSGLEAASASRTSPTSS